MGRPIHIDSWAHDVDLSDLKPKDRTEEKVLEILRRNGKFSVFEATCNQTIAGIMTRLCRSRIKTDNSMGYPWTVVVEIDDIALHGEGK